MMNRFYLTLVPLAVLLPSVFAKVQYVGGTIAGGDAGCQINGTCDPNSAQLPSGIGSAQMSKAIEGNGINLLRIPTSWQFLVNGNLGGDLDPENLSQYDELVQSCLGAGAFCMVDVHNFARWDGKIIGQGGPTDEQFAGFWGQLAKKYAAQDKIIFEIMDEPYDLNVSAWAQTCQSAVTAIRNAGAMSQMVLLPGTNFDRAATLISSRSADELLSITNPDGSVDNLLLDIHDILSEADSDDNAACTAENIDNLTAIAKYLRSKGRKGFVRETWASDDASCNTVFCAQSTFINDNSDVFVGLVSGGGGSLDISQNLTRSSQTEFTKRCFVVPEKKEVKGSATTSMWEAATIEPQLTPRTPEPQAFLAVSSSGSLVLTAVTLETPPPEPSADALRWDPSGSSLVLTADMFDTTFATLQLATGMPIPPAAQPSAVFLPVASTTPLNAAGSVAVGTVIMWICVSMAVVSVMW
ncbi:glycoside hydrolase family 5 protein [Xylaria sp. CBS 124048]|nr:glycoside hydrolase family 5 protein [Xylaria sp. CBS 124048]